MEKLIFKVLIFPMCYQCCTYFELYFLFGDDRPECFPITINSDDPYFNDSCMEFVRSAPAPSGYGCQAGMRNNLISSHILNHTQYIV